MRWSDQHRQVSRFARRVGVSLLTGVLHMDRNTSLIIISNIETFFGCWDLGFLSLKPHRTLV
jgi:hypothetical protein